MNSNVHINVYLLDFTDDNKLISSQTLQSSNICSVVLYWSLLDKLISVTVTDTDDILYASWSNPTT